MLAGPFVAVLAELGHRRIADRPGERRAVRDHLVEEGLVAADAFGDHPEESALQVGDRLVEAVQHLGDAGHGRLGQQLVGIRRGELRLQRMSASERRRPVEHLLPVGLVARRRRLDEQAGVAGLAVGAGGDELALGRLVELEELAQHAVRGVEEIVGQVVARVHEAGLEAAPDTVDHRTTSLSGARFERQQVDVQDLIGHPHDAIPPLHPPFRLCCIPGGTGHRNRHANGGWGGRQVGSPSGANRAGQPPVWMNTTSDPKRPSPARPSRPEQPLPE